MITSRNETKTMAEDIASSIVQIAIQISKETMINVKVTVKIIAPA